MAEFNTVEELLLYHAKKYYDDAYVKKESYGYHIVLVADSKEERSMTRLKSKALAYDLIEERGMTARIDKPGEVSVFD